MSDQAASTEAAAYQRRRLAFSGIEQRLMARWRTAGPPSVAPVVVAFSGGPDSLALAALLGRLARTLEADIELLHIDHGLRAESAAEAGRAIQLAAALGLPCTVVTLETGFVVRYPGLGIEEAARRERYLALARHARSRGTDWLATGHHREDQAETVLLHLLRGSGLSGAAGMADVSPLRVPWWPTRGEPVQLRLWRPLLAEPRATLLDYVGALGLEPNLDASNDDPFLRRNAIRSSVLPAMERAVPGAAAALARFATIASDEDRLLDELAASRAATAMGPDGSLSTQAALDLPIALRRRLVLRWLRERLPHGVEAGSERVEAVLSLMDRRNRAAVLEVGGGIVVQIVHDRLVADSSDRGRSSIGEPQSGTR